MDVEKLLDRERGTSGAKSVSGVAALVAVARSSQEPRLDSVNCGEDVHTR